MSRQHNGTWEHKWFVLLRRETQDMDIEYYDTDEEAWKEYRLCLLAGGDVQFGEQYLFVPRVA